MMKRRVSILLISASVLLLSAGCRNASSPVDTPATTQPETVAAAGDATPADTPTDALASEPTPSALSAELAVTETLTPTQTLTPTVIPARIVISQALNIRGGPGTVYPVLGYFSVGGDADIIGRSSDGLWWKITCPDQLNVPECWLIADPAFSQAEVLTEVPTAAAPNIPAPPPSPTPTPCVVQVPAGWVSHDIASGETVSELAKRRGTTAARLGQVNCLSTPDQVMAGDAIYLPAPRTFATGTGSEPGADVDAEQPGTTTTSTSASQTQPVQPPTIDSTSAATNGAGQTQPEIPAQAAAPQPVPGMGASTVGHGIRPTAIIQDAAALAPIIGLATTPNLGTCRQTENGDKHIYIGTDTRESDKWPVGTIFGICLNGFSRRLPVTLTITESGVSGQAIVYRQVDKVGADYVAIEWRGHPSDSDGEKHFIVAAQQDGSPIETSFTIEPRPQDAAKRTMFLLYPRVAGEETFLSAESSIGIGLAGYTSNEQRLAICRFDDSFNPICLSFPNPVALEAGQAEVYLDLSDLETGFQYTILEGTDSDLTQPRVLIELIDPVDR